MEQFVPKYTEDTEQQAVIRWAAFQSGGWPELENLYHVPNEGKRGKKAAGIAKALGLKAGVPDLILDYPKGIYHGLRIEMKVLPNRPTQSQLEWMQRMQDAGYMVAICYDSESAIALITEYIKLTAGEGLHLPLHSKYKIPALKHQSSKLERKQK